MSIIKWSRKLVICSDFSKSITLFDQNIINRNKRISNPIKNIPRSHFYNSMWRVLPAEGSFSGSLVLCKTIVPESTVINPQRTDTMLLALWPDQSYSTRKSLEFQKKSANSKTSQETPLLNTLNIMALAKIVSDVNIA